MPTMSPASFRFGIELEHSLVSVVGALGCAEARKELSLDRGRVGRLEPERGAVVVVGLRNRAAVSRRSVPRARAPVGR